MPNLLRFARWGFPQMLRLDTVFAHRLQPSAMKYCNSESTLLEHQIAHEVKDPNGRAYNRTAFLVERKRVMQRWSDYLDRLKSGPSEEIVEIQKRA
jgi:hypothetical protein